MNTIAVLTILVRLKNFNFIKIAPTCYEKPFDIFESVFTKVQIDICDGITKCNIRGQFDKSVIFWIKDIFFGK